VVRSPEPTLVDGMVVGSITRVEWSGPSASEPGA